MLGITSPFAFSVCSRVSCAVITLSFALQLHEAARRETEVPCSLFGLEPRHRPAEERQVTRRHHGAGWDPELAGKHWMALPSVTGGLVSSCPHLSACVSVQSQFNLHTRCHLKHTGVHLQERTRLACLTQYLMRFWQVCCAPVACVGTRRVKCLAAVFKRRLKSHESNCGSVKPPPPHPPPAVHSLKLSLLQDPAND